MLARASARRLDGDGQVVALNSKKGSGFDNALHGRMHRGGCPA